jgi:hypothetical protein
MENLNLDIVSKSKIPHHMMLLWLSVYMILGKTLVHLHQSLISFLPCPLVMHSMILISTFIHTTVLRLSWTLHSYFAIILYLYALYPCLYFYPYSCLYSYPCPCLCSCLYFYPCPYRRLYRYPCLCSFRYF